MIIPTKTRLISDMKFGDVDYVRDELDRKFRHFDEQRPLSTPRSKKLYIRTCKLSFNYIYALAHVHGLNMRCDLDYIFRNEGRNSTRIKKLKKYLQGVTAICKSMTI